MNNMAKRVRQILTMLLAVSMLAGSIPMNAFAMETSDSVVETEAVSEGLLLEESSVADSLTLDAGMASVQNNNGSQGTEEKQEIGGSQESGVNLNSEGTTETGATSTPDEIPETDVIQNQGESQENDENQNLDGSQETDGNQNQGGSQENDENQKSDGSQETDENQDSDESQSSGENQESGGKQANGEKQEIIEEPSVSENNIEVEKEEVEEEILPQKTVSENHMEIKTTSGSEEEKGKELPITFSVFGASEEYPLKITQIITDEKGSVVEIKELDSNTTTSAAGKAFKFKLEPAKGHKVTEVKIGTLSFNAEDGIYTTPILTAETEIKVTVEKLKEYKVTFSYDSELVYGLDVKMDRNDVTLVDNVAYDMLEDSAVSFTLNLDGMAKVVKVTANGKEVNATEGSEYTYTLEPLEEDVVVNIETSLDEQKCNTLDIVIWGHRDSVSVKNGDNKYDHNDRLLTKDTEERITVHLDSNYVVDQVLLNGVDVKFMGTYAEYDVDFSQNKNQLLVLYTTPKKSTEEKKIVFANKSSNITYEVNTKAPGDKKKTIVKKDALKKNTYIVNASETLMEFSITYKDGYKPKVTLPEDVLYDVTSNGKTDTYSLAVATLGNAENPTEIIIEEVPQIRTISVVYDAERLSKLEAIENGKFIEGVKSYDPIKKLTTLKYTYVHGTQIILQLETPDDFFIGEIKEIAQGQISKVEPKKKEYSYTVNVDKDKTIELGLDGTYTTKLFDNQGNSTIEVEAENNIYTVEAGREYKLLLYKGKDAQIVTNAVLKSGKTTLKDKPEIINSENVHFEIPTNQAGKTLTLEVSCKEGVKNYTHTVQLKVLPAAKITKISSVSSGKLSQTVDSVKEYTFTSNVPQANAKFGVEIVTAKAGDEIWDEEEKAELNQKANENFAAEIVENKLKITVKTSVAGEKAQIKIYDKSKSTESGEKYYLPGGTITITSKAPAFVTSNPSVSLKNATNLDLILSLSMKGLGELQNGEFWYKVVGTPKYTEKTAQAVKDNTKGFVEYYEYTPNSQLETVRVVDRVNKAIEEGKFGYKTDYKIKVYLVQTSDKEVPVETGDNKNVVFTSKASKEVTMSTKVPAYETKLDIKSIKNTLYSGQKDVIVASPVFSKATTYQEITVEAKQEGIEAKTNEDNNIVVSVGEDVKPGKYTIEVTADIAENTVPAKKSFTIQVEQGIYALTLDTPKEVYKQYNKQATLKAKLTYNEGNKVQPKNKKVEWGLQVKQGENVIDIDKEHPYYNMISIKDGTVTINKSFIVSNNSEKNMFRVKVTAKDYQRKEGEEKVGYSDWIEITNEKVTLGELVLVKKADIEIGYYEVVARSGSKASVDNVNGSKLVILKKGIPERDKYTESDFSEVSDDLLIYSCNSNVINITEDKTIETKNIASKVQFTVTAADGSNVKTTLSNLNIIYADAGDLGVTVTQDNIAILDSAVAGTTKFYGAKDETLTVNIYERNEKGNSEKIYGVNYQLKVQGAKIIESDTLSGTYVIVGTSDTIVLKLVNNTKKYTKTFTLQNAALANQEVKKSKAITLKVEGGLKTGEFTEEQKITYTLPKGSIGKYTHAYVTVDTLDSLNEKKASNYKSLVEASQGTIGSVQQLGSDGKIVISFKPAEGKADYSIPEVDFTYKLNIAVGTMTEEYEFKADVKPNAVTIKTKKPTLAAAKLNTSYDMSVKEGGEVKLTLDNKKVALSNVGKLMNRNVNGVENKFAQFFEVIEVKGEFKLKLKSGVNISDIGTNDWKGYISQYTYTDGIKEKTVYNTVVTVNHKDLVQEYSLSKAVVLSPNAGNPINTNIKLKAGKTEAKVKYVYVPENQIFDVNINEDGSLNFQSEAGVTIKSTNKCTVYVVPEYSYYVSVFEGLWDDSGITKDGTDLIDTIKKYGIKLTATIEVKSKTSTTGKIKFSSSNLKPKFKMEHFVPDEKVGFVVDEADIRELDKFYNDGTYVLTVPYTKAVDCDVVSVYNHSVNSLVKVEKTEGKDSVTLTVDKEALREKYGTDKKIYGKTISVKAVVTFGEGTKNETITFEVTLPKQSVQLKAAQESLNKVAWADLEVAYKNLPAESIISENQHMIAENINSVLSKDGDLVASISGEVSVPTQLKEGELIYTIRLRDVATGDYRNITAMIPLDKILAEPSELTDELGAAIARWSRNGVTNLTAPEEIISSVRSRVLTRNGDVIYKHLRLYAKDVIHVEATENEAGVIKGTFCIANVVDKGVTTLEQEFEFEIPKLMTMAEAVVKVKEAVEQIVIYNDDLKYSAKKKEKTQEILEIAEKVLVGQDYFVEVKRGSELDGTPANGESTGNASIELKLIYLTTERISTNITCEFTVSQEAGNVN